MCVSVGECACVSLPAVSCGDADPGRSMTRTTAMTTSGSRWVRQDAKLTQPVTPTNERTHFLRSWWDTISTPQKFTVFSFFCFPSAHTHSRQLSSPPPQVFVCVYVYACVAIISNHVSVLSLGVCEPPPPGLPICVVVAVMVIAPKLSLLPDSPFHSWSTNNDTAKAEVLISLYGR